ncbi:DNA cytosine methyltransferase [Leptospira bandrabouensis]|uniref:Cytosine-specific methyltransferase n=1 Tax=Leptospira bandrabouensis TaxID=2484903 RepID=A0A6H3NPE0_9LEPT|nr:DNA cytosine methyltransferase [Leptospira bandrabouensis]MCG6154059.1 DNA cytosine methyltransferase [Leptospira bandrabouensis]TGN10305.1 DNA cytosine methyltransferase [Leptospira bandrabouensis]
MTVSNKIRFIDLFAGIGGFRLGFEKTGHFSCVFSSEIDRHAAEIYSANFGDTPHGDITSIQNEDIPPFEVLLAGFPCQPFSIAGEKKGFEDTRGTMFFEILRILQHHKPKVVVLENVKHFKDHDKGKTLKTVLDKLNLLGYSTVWKLLNAKDFGVPQNRERTIIIGCLENKSFHFNFKTNPIIENKITNILDGDDASFEYLDESEYTLIQKPKKQESGLIFVGYRNKKIRTVGVRENTEHLSRVHKQPNRIYSSEGIHPTIASQEPTGRYFILHKEKVRKLTLNECIKLMGFDNTFKFIGSSAKIYNRLGNSIVVPMVEQIANQIYLQLFSNSIETVTINHPQQLELFSK